MAMFAKSLRLPSLGPPYVRHEPTYARDNSLSFGCCSFGMLIESQLTVEPQPKYFRAVQSLICSPFRRKEVD